MRLEPGALSWLHVADLHVTGRNEQNLTDLRGPSPLAAAVQPQLAVLPGGNANDRTKGQFKRVWNTPMRLLKRRGAA